MEYNTVLFTVYGSIVVTSSSMFLFITALNIDNIFIFSKDNVVTFSCEPWSACLLCLLFWGTINEEIYGKGYYYHQNGGDTLINYSTRYLSVRFLFGWIKLSCILYLVFFKSSLSCQPTPQLEQDGKRVLIFHARKI